MADLDQQRAAFAWQRVEEAKKKMDDANKKYSDYKNLAKGAPAMIMNNGLMQTLAFLRSKGEEHKHEGKWDHHDLLLADILAWLHRPRCLPEKDYRQAMEWLHGKASSEQYRLATEETMHLLRWLRQFADTGCAD